MKSKRLILVLTLGIFVMLAACNQDYKKLPTTDPQKNPNSNVSATPGAQASPANTAATNANR